MTEKSINVIRFCDRPHLKRLRLLITSGNVESKWKTDKRSTL